MFYTLVNNILESLHTIQLSEDTLSCSFDSDSDDPNFGGEEFYFDSDDPLSISLFDSPANVPLNINYPPLEAPSCAPLGKPYRRSPNDSFHDSDPYMYYESYDYPTDLDYLNAIHTLIQSDGIIYSKPEYSNLRFDPLHFYINAKMDNIEYHIGHREWKSIVNFYSELKRVYANTLDEYDRIEDVKWNNDENDDLYI